MAFSPLPVVDFNRNPLDVSPINEAVANWQNAQYKNTQQQMAGKQLQMQEELQPMHVKAAQLQNEAAQNEVTKQKAQAVSGLVDSYFNPTSPGYIKDDAERAAKWNQFLPTLKGMSHLDDPELGPMFRDPKLGPQMVQSIANGYMGDLNKRLLTAQVQGAEENLAATRAGRELLGWNGASAATPQQARMPTPTTASTSTAPSQPVTFGNQTQATTPFSGAAVTTGPQLPQVPQGASATAQTGFGYTAQLPQQGQQEQAQAASVQELAKRAASVGPDGTAVDLNNKPLFNIPQEFRRAQIMMSMPGLASAGETHMKFMQGILDKGAMPNQAGGVMDIPGSAESAARRKGLEETATGNAKYYDTLHKGLVGSGMIAAQQKQNLNLIQQIIADPGFGFGSVSGLQQATLQAAATLGIAPEAAANREVFNMTVGRILADQFAGMKSLASATGEQGARVFKSMLDVEEKAIPSAGDSVEGLRRKIAILNHAGDLMMQWGDKADQYVIKYGRLDPQFDMDLRADIAKARIPLVEKNGGAAPTEKGNQAQESGGPVTKEKLLAMPDGPVDLGGQRFMKQGSQLFPLQGDLGSITNPYASKPQVTAPGQHAYENGRLYKRTPNYFSDRWEEAPWQWPVRAQ